MKLHQMKLKGITRGIVERKLRKMRRGGSLKEQVRVDTIKWTVCLDRTSNEGSSTLPQLCDGQRIIKRAVCLDLTSTKDARVPKMILPCLGVELGTLSTNFQKMKFTKEKNIC